MDDDVKKRRQDLEKHFNAKSDKTAQYTDTMGVNNKE
jgi:hypothetical protein